MLYCDMIGWNKISVPGRRENDGAARQILPPAPDARGKCCFDCPAWDCSVRTPV